MAKDQQVHTLLRHHKPDAANSAVYIEQLHREEDLQTLMRRTGGHMKRLAWMLVIVMIAIAARLEAQTLPDLSGEWTAPGASLTIRQDARTLVVISGADTTTYNLDGADSRFERRTDRGTVSQLTAQANWIGSALLITTATVRSLGSWQDLEVYSLD
jgi:hypothetical protein